MKASVSDECIACGLCVEVCPTVFELGEDDEIAKVIADPIPPEAEDAAREAAESCPTDAITLEE